ncbi:hypothetical protein DPEC_G00263860 [Dallia pectoralis]|uniref:Uncharacterized protein n=1 Tax=Dallia pectoralis TaxID=75939 RepID=A0ACC2FSG6_DALPE|nr:hypothetical protein DPEC_G00263860 [Dallia pectoralis]
MNEAPKAPCHRKALRPNDESAEVWRHVALTRLPDTRHEAARGTGMERRCAEGNGESGVSILTEGERRGM